MKKLEDQEKVTMILADSDSTDTIEAIVKQENGQIVIRFNEDVSDSVVAFDLYNGSLQILLYNSNDVDDYKDKLAIF